MLPASRTHRAARQRLAQGGLFVGVVAAFGCVAAQLVNLGATARPAMTLAVAEPIAKNFSRPDIVDRNGRLLATDLETPSLYADPMLVIDRDEVVEKVATVLPDIDQAELRAALSDKQRRFVWIRRGLSPAVAQRLHDLGLPGLSFRSELRRAYPAGTLAGHVLGHVNIDNKGMAGVEKYIDDVVGVDAVHAATLSTKAPVRLSLDLGVQHALEDELGGAMRNYRTVGAAGLVLNVRTGEVLASASLPRIDPARPQAKPDPQYLDKNAGATFELGSVFKIISVAMALDEGLAKPSTMLDVREPLPVGPYLISDAHGGDRPLSVTEVFTHSSNVGAGLLALKAGPERMKAFFTKLGLLTPMQIESGPISPPQTPRAWERAELVTMSYGHGLAVAPIQFAAAAATILNGGIRVTPKLVKSNASHDGKQKPLVTAETARQMARLFRLNVTNADGTGVKAEAAGYRVGGKTGTADLAAGGGYRDDAALSSFLGAFPMDAPRYLTFVLLFEPKASAETGGQRTAAANAAPVTSQLITRIAPLLDVAPLNVVATQ
ncbi:MAG: peptidoglycan D,D-transpeptidase FtsI family protein [Hyphomicrobium sp.]